MGLERWRGARVLVYRRPVDMRKAIDGLSLIVAAELGCDAADGSVYVFVNRGRDKVKCLVWHRNGYWLLYKRLERQRFKWPDWFESESMTLTHEQLDYLLDGYDLNGMRPHRELTFARAF